MEITLTQTILSNHTAQQKPTYASLFLASQSQPQSKSKIGQPAQSQKDILPSKSPIVPTTTLHLTYIPATQAVPAETSVSRLRVRSTTTGKYPFRSTANFL